MSHSIAARFSSRPVSRFVRPPARGGERQLGLRRPDAIQPAGCVTTFLYGSELAPVGRLRRTGAAPSQAGRAGRAATIGPAVRIRWTRPTSPAPGARSGVASAPWRG
jgi:hypothetical protein